MGKKRRARVGGDAVSIGKILDLGQYSIKERELTDPENAKEVNRSLGPEASL